MCLCQLGGAQGEDTYLRLPLPGGSVYQLIGKYETLTLIKYVCVLLICLCELKHDFSVSVFKY